ncbi:unnamed protein product, partial [Amoebophrya sp. A25]
IHELSHEDLDYPLRKISEILGECEQRAVDAVGPPKRLDGKTAYLVREFQLRYGQRMARVLDIEAALYDLFGQNYSLNLHAFDVLHRKSKAPGLSGGATGVAAGVTRSLTAFGASARKAASTYGPAGLGAFASSSARLKKSVAAPGGSASGARGE